MKLVRNFRRNADDLPIAMTIGKFDGVHLGHQALLKKVKQAATWLGIETAVMTFSPHPRDFFANRGSASMHCARIGARISNLRDTFAALSEAGVDRVIYQRFDETFSRMTADAFIRDVLVKALHVRWITVGCDFRFGAERKGDVDRLRRAGRLYGFHVEAVPSLYVEGQPISSSRVRIALQHADLDSARKMLGRSYSVSGRLTPTRGSSPLSGKDPLKLHSAAKTFLPIGLFSIRLHGAAIEPIHGTLRIVRGRQDDPFPEVGAWIELEASIAVDRKRIVTIEMLSPLETNARVR
ncbi:adenylyltransferase/cytidyltransferase family protein [Caballeronia sp. LjRoot34]|uniref:adenylyltransferase/cytidyltransferase family protein n=1 Tax=Caballeronia sp. LjRoot34 TaxID=3342325 RepID=UPI003ECC73DD